MNTTIRSGQDKDIPWISSLLKEGANQGHFLPPVAEQAGPLLNSILSKGGVTMMKLRDEIQAPYFISGYILVAEINDTPSSFLVTLQEDDEVELHLAGTKKQFRRNGCFHSLIKHEVSKYDKNYKIYARCYKKSTWAINALEKEGFEVTKNEEVIELTLIR